MAYHVPVLAKECMELLAIRPEGVYVDVTFGGGGHSRLILEKLGGKGRLIAFDQDEDVKANEILDPRFTLAQHNFRIFRRFLRLEGVDKVDGILADLGVSSHQLDVPERGFSHRFDEVLDMRMDQRSERTAADLINTYDESQLLEVFSRYGEVRNSRSLAARLVAEFRGYWAQRPESNRQSSAYEANVLAITPLCDEMISPGRNSGASPRIRTRICRVWSSPCCRYTRDT